MPTNSQDFMTWAGGLNIPSPPPLSINAVLYGEEVSVAQRESILRATRLSRNIFDAPVRRHIPRNEIEPLPLP